MKKITALAALLAIPAMAAPTGYFEIPGTNTTLKLLGKIQIREAYGLNGDGMDDVSYAGLPTADDVAAGGRKNQEWNQEGQWSGQMRYYLGVTTTTPSSFGDIKTVIYGRFKHSSGNGSESGQSVKFNLEQGYLQVGGLKLGTDWSMFGYGAWEPNTLFGCVADEDGTWTNVRQLSYMGSPMPGLDLGLSLESNNTSLNDDDNTYPGSSRGTDNGTHPNISAVAAYTQPWGGVTAGVNFQQRKDWTKNGSNDKEGTGFSWVLSGGWNITPKDQLTAMILDGGEGYGSWNDGFYADGNDYSFYKSTAISLSYTHTWNDLFSSAVTVAQTKWDKDRTAQAALGYVPDNYKATEYIVNTTWQVTKTVSFGVEYQHTQMKGDLKNWQNDDGSRTDTNKLDMIRFKVTAMLF